MGILMSFMVGPVFFVLLETSATKGFRAGVFFDLGVILADMLFLAIAYFSSFQLLENLGNLPGLYVFGGAILLVYGLTTFFNKEFIRGNPDLKPRRGGYLSLFIKGFLLNFINIGVLMFWLGVIIVVGPSVDNDPQRIMVFFGSMLGAYFLVDLIKILLAKQLRRKLTVERIRLVKKTLGVILIIFGAVLIVKGFLPKDQLNIEKGIELLQEERQDQP